MNNESQIIRKDAKNCFVESLNDRFACGKIHWNFAAYDLSKPEGSRISISMQASFWNFAESSNAENCAICCRQEKRAEINRRYIKV